MAGFSVDISGLAQLEANLDKLKKPDAAVRKALRAGGEVFQRALQTEAPVAKRKSPSSNALIPGALKADIEITPTKDENGNLAVNIGPGKHTAHVARWVEYGHNMPARRGGRTKKGKRAWAYKAGTVPPHEFIQPAYNAVKEQAVEATCSTLAQAIENGEVK